MISLKHISTLPTFNQTKFSSDSTDSSYFLGSDQTQIFQGTPDVKYNDLCYIKCSNLQYTHGHLYGSTEVGEAHVSLTQEEYNALSEEEKNNGKIYLIKESTIPDLIDQLPLATTSSNGLMSAEDKGKLSGVKKITGEWLSISNFNGIGYITVRKPVIPDGKILIRYDCEIKNATTMLAVMNPCDCLTETTAGYSTIHIRYVIYSDVVCNFDFRPTAIYL